MASTESRAHDVVLFGATGFVGKLIAQHLAETAGDGVRIALAGRDRAKLLAVRGSLPGQAAQWPLVEADARDEASLAALAESTRVVLTTVGPYLTSGYGLAKACAEAGTHYADLTGEVLFVRRTVAELHETARRTGARIVHSCGFDSMPSDLAVWLTARAAADADAGSLTRTTTYVRTLRGAVSGGTVASGVGIMDAVDADPALGPVAGDPNALLPEGAPRLTSDRVLLEKDAERKHWCVPFFMGGFNRQIVNRSNALAGYAYGRAFSYREMHDLGGGPAGLARAVGLATGSSIGRAALGFGPTRAALDRVLPGSGDGPSEKTMANGKVELEVIADTTTGDRFVTTAAVDKDPGYTGTAIMIGQAALALAQDELPGEGGVLTPATALGGLLVERLRAHGFRFATVRR
ncbi:saccharopine dehydrogenase family protein [Nigerium massiliense]|uniref:saccharopine dehydrogenase family protein n=1 Tax=Nigerium massiliense TaxID=1522317 RepID=UPI00058BE17F|nr:saccharopine dehydrogenase NADP-binding domain-containing protein [Nigerium massiliense]